MARENDGDWLPRGAKKSGNKIEKKTKDTDGTYRPGCSSKKKTTKTNGTAKPKKTATTVTVETAAEQPKAAEPATTTVTVETTTKANTTKSRQGKISLRDLQKGNRLKGPPKEKRTPPSYDSWASTRKKPEKRGPKKRSLADTELFSVKLAKRLARGIDNADKRAARNSKARQKRLESRDELTGKSLKALYALYQKASNLEDSLEETLENYGGDRALLRRDMLYGQAQYLYGTGAAIKQYNRENPTTGKGVHTETLLQIWKKRTGKSKCLEALINEKGSKYRARKYLLEQLGLPVPKRTYIPTGNPRGRPPKDPNAPRKTKKK